MRHKKRFTITVDPSILVRARWAVRQSHNVTLAGLVSQGLGLAVDRLERLRKRPFRVRRNRFKLQAGRPRKAA